MPFDNSTRQINDWIESNSKAEMIKSFDEERIHCRPEKNLPGGK